jgi:hypothetical protein
MGGSNPRVRAPCAPAYEPHAIVTAPPHAYHPAVPALLLFVVALVLRVLFVAATADGGPGWHAGFQGDAPVWQGIAANLAAGRPDEQLALPLRPPGMHWLVAQLWNGAPGTQWTARLLFVALGALVAPLVWWLLRRHVGARVAFATALLCAASSNLLLLSSGLHNETLYLVLALAALACQPVGTRRVGGAGAGAVAWRGPTALLWGALHGASCLVRAEHILTAAVLLPLALHATGRRGARSAALAAVALALALLPWQLRANALVDAYNQGPQPAPELPKAALPWDDDALATVRALPAFQRYPVLAFVTETVKARGGSRVRQQDLAVVRQAYDCWPEPLPKGFLAIYGGLNFFLANSKEAAGGFSAAALDREPPLEGGDVHYPPGLRGMLPRNGVLTLSYPPHLDAIVHGSQKGWAEIAADPGAALARVGAKLWHAAEGAVGGVGGYALPIGLSGERRQVDLVTATSGWSDVWRLLVLGVAAFGLWRLRGCRGVWPLLAFAGTKVAVVAVYFGYARQGALCAPVVALGVVAAFVGGGAGGAAGEGVANGGSVGRARALPASRWLLLAAVALLAIDAVRSRRTTVAVDGEPTNAFAPTDFRARRIEFR